MREVVAPRNRTVFVIPAEAGIQSVEEAAHCAASALSDRALPPRVRAGRIALAWRPLSRLRRAGQTCDDRAGGPRSTTRLRFACFAVKPKTQTISRVRRYARLD